MYKIFNRCTNQDVKRSPTSGRTGSRRDACSNTCTETVDQGEQSVLNRHVRPPFGRQRARERRVEWVGHVKFSVREWRVDAGDQLYAHIGRRNHDYPGCRDSPSVESTSESDRNEQSQRYQSRPRRCTQRLLYREARRGEIYDIHDICRPPDPHEHDIYVEDV